MEIKINNPKFIIKWAERKVKDLEREALEQVSRDTEKIARLHFNRAKQEIPAVDTEIMVRRMKLGENSYKIICGGRQVLFVEFGAGIAHSTETPTVVINNGKEIEYATRPAGIVAIGHYGKGRGMDDSWIFQDVRLIPDNGRNHTHLIRKSRGYYVYRTGGIRPVRALYRAVGTAFKNLGGGKRMKKLGGNNQ